ncbi:hypothetical protein PAXINDRAFT_11321 [Paxillus involutus ATCC 200175]|uniref:Uncharacterized protein n=1 Tax=Paxillus involutus ATCC 200175 TaxID=664439 RepID=A0A0C9TZC8_PAXIN|nr:hypothetical protein PAXINDRAFT_11321 [Paxillus involutus ATCC 200175]
MSNRTLHGMQLDAFSCGVAAINTIKHAVFDDELFADENKFCLRMEEFLALAYSHLETGADDVHGSEHHSDYSPESSSNIEVFNSPGLLLDVSPLPPARQKMAGALAQGHGLLRFFPKVSQEEHLKNARIPSAWEVEDQERNEHRLCIQQFEHQAQTAEHSHAAQSYQIRMGKFENVPELLGMENFYEWRRQAEHLLLGEGVYNLVSKGIDPNNYVEYASVMPTPLLGGSPTSSEREAILHQQVDNFSGST